MLTRLGEKARNTAYRPPLEDRAETRGHAARKAFLPRARSPIGRSHVLETAAAIGVFVAISLWAAHGQRAERVFGDATQYHHMSQQFAAGVRPVTADGPFVFRIATPWLAGTVSSLVSVAVPTRIDRAIEDASGLKGVTPFYVVNILSALAALLLFQAYLRCFIQDGRLRLLLLTMWMAQWHAPVRFVYFYPANVEPLFLAALIAALLVIERTRDRSPTRTAWPVAVLVFAGTLCRDSMVLAAIAFVAVHRPMRIVGERRWAEGAATLVPLVAFVGAMACARRVGLPANDYRWWAGPLAMIAEKQVFTWVLAWFFTFGPAALALIAGAHGVVSAFLRRRPDLLVYLTACGVVAFVGGTDTERLLGWAAPVMYVLLGLAIENRRAALLRAPVLMTILVFVHLASTRLLWPIPTGIDEVRPFATLDASWASLAAVLDKLLIIENYYSNLWSFYGSRAIHALILVFDVGLVLAVAMTLREGRRTEAGNIPRSRRYDGRRASPRLRPSKMSGD